MTGITVNGADLGTTFGWYPDRVDGWLGAPARNFAAITMPKRLGVVMPVDPTYQAREIRISGSLNPQALASRVTAEAKIRDHMMTGLVTIVVDDGTTPLRAIDGYTRELVVEAPTPTLAPVWSRISATVTCPEPVWRETTMQVIGFNATARAMPLGTAPVAPLIRIMGAATNPTLKYKNASGQTLNTCQFTITLASTDYLLIDCANGLIQKSVSGTVSDARSTFVSTNDALPVLDPADGDYINSVWPMLTVDLGTAVAIYAKRHW